MRKLFFVILVAMMFAIGFYSAGVRAETLTARDIVEQIGNQIVSVLNNEQLDNGEKQKHLVEIVAKYFDIEDIGNRALGQVRTWSKTERAQYQKEFKPYLICKIISSELVQLQGRSSFRVTGAVQNGDSRHYKVSAVGSNSQYQNVKLTLSLHLVNNVWKIYDFQIESFSLVAELRNIFMDYIQSFSRMLSFLGSCRIRF